MRKFAHTVVPCGTTPDGRRIVTLRATDDTSRAHRALTLAGYEFGLHLAMYPRVTYIAGWCQPKVRVA